MSLTSHHTPNVLPRGHTREDYDYLYKDGVAGPIRVTDPPKWWGDEAPRTTSIWCKVHGWEREIVPAAKPEL